MAGFTNGEAAATLDARWTGTEYVAYSENGTSESANLARTAVTAWDAATVADPSVKQNTNLLTTANATGAGTITHFALYSASSGGTQRTDWTALSASQPITAGGRGEWAAGALKITLT
jgi:hypothetical protein